MSRLCDAAKCSGCGACVNRCPKGAISMTPDVDGFLYPAIDESKCVSCGLCTKACPVLTPVAFSPRAEVPLAAWTTDDAIRRTSSSGGLFSVFANHVIEQNGAANGVAFDSNFNLTHRIVETKEGVVSVRGSKYVQSSIGLLYREVERILKSGRTFLFTSTPCQVAGLRSFLGRPYDNLITCDILCHGVPSPEKFRTYLSQLAAPYGGVKGVANFEFRDLSGWGYGMQLFLKDGRKINLPLRNDAYFRPFVLARQLRSSCYQCPYARSERVSDLTLGDFWGLPLSFQVRSGTEKGCSLLLINTKKGMDLVRDCSSGLVQTSRTWRECRANHQLFHPVIPCSRFETSIPCRILKKLFYWMPRKTYLSFLNLYYRKQR